MIRWIVAIFVIAMVAQVGSTLPDANFIAVLLVIIVVAYIVIQGMRGYRDEMSASSSNIQSPSFHWPSIGNFEFEVVGESHYQKSLEKIANSRTKDLREEDFIAILVPEDDNKHDESAVRVDIEGMTVGYMSRDDARKFRRRLAGKKMAKAVTSCDAMIGGGYERSDGSTAMYGVALDLKPFDS